MNYQHIENLLIGFRGRSLTIKTTSGAVYEGTITDITNDYVALQTEKEGGEGDLVIVLVHSIESLLPHPE